MQLVHGGDIYTLRQTYHGEILDFSANINPLGLPPGVEQAAKQAVEVCAHYPDPLCRKLTAAIAAHEGVAGEHIICGNGAADLIFRVVQARRPQYAVLVAPGFAEYEAALQAADCSITHHLLKEDDGFALTESFLECLTPQTDMVFLCDPNNPTGACVAPSLLEQIIQACERRRILLVLDRCFIDFVDSPAPLALPLPPNVFLLKAFTKLYAMAGLRLGYGICADQALLGQMHRCGQPWSVSTPAQAAGVTALAEEDYRRRTKALIAAERAVLTQGLQEQGMQVYGSQANYIFFKAPLPDLAKRLQQQGILIRSCANYVGLTPYYYRVAVRTRSENQRLLAAMAKACKEE